MRRPTIPAPAAPARRNTEEHAITGVVERDAVAFAAACVGGVAAPTLAEVGAERFEPVTALLLGALGWPLGGSDPWGAGQGDSVPPSSHTAVS